MTTNHPITPSPELVEQWKAETAHTTKDEIWHVAVQAARWGADQELEACLRLVEIDAGEDAYDFARYIRAARRPKPLSLKEQALAALEQVEADFSTGSFGDTIRCALEALPND